MASGDRFYEMELRHRAALHGDVGSLLKIKGLLIGGEGAQALLMLPDEFVDYPALRGDIYHLTPEQWTDWLQRSDNPEVLINGSLEKAFHRKLRYDISGAVQQKVWAADGFKCFFCGKPMGVVQLTVDHFIPLEMSGKNDTSNFISACRRCNKNKGAMDPKDFCGLMAVDYTMAVQYLENRKLP